MSKTDKSVKRKLTKAEITNILSFIQPNPDIPYETAMSVVNMNKSRLRKQLITIEVYPDIIPELTEHIKRDYYASLIDAGENVGVICAQSIGERQTQNTLNSFHKAGQSEKTMTVGVPRMQELLNATKKPRIVNNKVYFTTGTESLNDLRETVGHSIVSLTFSDIATSIKIDTEKHEEPWYPAFKMLYHADFESYTGCVTIKINTHKLFEHKITLEQIAQTVQEEYGDVTCVWSPPEFAQIDVFVDVNEITLPEKRLSFINTTNALEIYLEECVQATLEKMIICGIPAITEIFYTHETTDGVDEWFLETNGVYSKSISKQYSSLKRLLALDIVDETRTISNNVWDIYEVLGVEAARQFLIEEYSEITEGINICHCRLLIDRMTHAGGIASVTRYTLKKDESGPMGKASFEETMENFTNAGVQGDIETTNGVSASIICGKRANMGTGIMGISIDLDALPEEHDEYTC